MTGHDMKKETELTVKAFLAQDHTKANLFMIACMIIGILTGQILIILAGFTPYFWKAWKAYKEAVA